MDVSSWGEVLISVRRPVHFRSSFSQMDSSAQLAGFYVDEEVGIPDRDFDLGPMVPEGRVILSFEGEQYGRLPESFGAATFSPSVDFFGYYANNPICEPTRSLPAETQNGPDPQPEDGGGMVDSDQVRAFWRLYMAYPTYLRNIKKRNRKKTRKAKIAAPK
jgi:hypothetical protein